MLSSPPLVGERRSPLVSVIIPAYNAAVFIERTLHSVLKQTYHNLEILVVDDGSQDRTRQLVEALAEEDRRIRLLSQPNQGVAAARNLAIEHARGVYIAPLDADDIWFPEKLERQVACMEQGGGSMGLVYSWWVMIDENDNLLQASSKWDVKGNVFEALVFINFVGNASVPLMRRACIEQVGGYSTYLKEMGGQGCEDWDLALRIASQFQVGVAPGYLCGYRRVSESMTMHFDAMGRSHQLIVEQMQQSHLQVLPTLYHWSSSIFYSYLGKLGYREEDYRAAKYWFVQALAADAMLVLSRPFLKQIIKSFLWTLDTKWVRVWRRQANGSQDVVQQRKLAFHSAPLTLESLTKDHGAYPRAWTWKSLHPYDWVCWYRWRKVQRLLQKSKVRVEKVAVSRQVDAQVRMPQMETAE